MNHMKELTGHWRILMKKRKKIILWIAVIVLVLCSITALSIKPDIDTSGKDLFLYRMSGFSLFLIWLFGLIIELDVFHIKKNIPLVKSDRISLHIIFWIILIILSLIVFGVFYNSTSQDFKNALSEVTENETDSNKVEKPEPIASDNVTKKADDAEYEENIPASESSFEIQSDSTNEENNSDISSRLIEDETYYFDDASFIVNGIQLTVNNIILHREYKPEGYSLEVEYSLLNQNDTDATFEFSSQSGNNFVLNGQKARMTKQTSHSQNHCTEYHLNSKEETEAFIGDFYALSSSAGKMIDGENFEAIDISNLYSGQQLTINFQINGICNDQTETMTISFDINL